MHLFNGSEYDYDQDKLVNHFFGSLYFYGGSIVYDDILYSMWKNFDNLMTMQRQKNWHRLQPCCRQRKDHAFSFSGHYFKDHCRQLHQELKQDL